MELNGQPSRKSRRQQAHVAPAAPVESATQDPVDISDEASETESEKEDTATPLEGSVGGSLASNKPVS